MSERLSVEFGFIRKMFALAIEILRIRLSKEETGMDVEVRKLIGVYTDCDMKYAGGDEAHSIVTSYKIRGNGSFPIGF